MTVHDIISLGWKDRHPGQDDKTKTYRYDADGYHYIMSFHVKGDEDGTHQVMINYVDGAIDHNEWENSETWFYGHLTTQVDLKNVMQYLSIID